MKKSNKTKNIMDYSEEEKDEFPLIVIWNQIVTRTTANKKEEYVRILISEDFGSCFLSASDIADKIREKNSEPGWWI